MIIVSSKQNIQFYLKGLQTFADIGYTGMNNDFPEFYAVLPHKKRKGKELTIPQKEWSKQQSRIRIKIEHIISHVKKFKISSRSLA